MQRAIWRGEGTGRLEDPYILHKPADFREEEAFNIFIEESFLGKKEIESYFVFSDNIMKLYILALLVNGDDMNLYFKSDKAIEYTLINGDKQNILDGPYSVNTFDGISYITKLQIFNESDFLKGDLFIKGFTDTVVDIEIEHYVDDIIIKAFLKLRDHDNLLKINEHNQLYLDYADIKELIEWNDISNKPEEYPPSPHRHEMIDIIDLDTEFDRVDERIDDSNDRFDQEIGLTNDRIDVVKDDLAETNRNIGLLETITIPAIKDDINSIEDDITDVRETYIKTVVFDIQMKEKQNKKPDGVNDLIVGGLLNPVYIDSMYATAIYEVMLVEEMLSLQDLTIGDIVIVEESSTTYILKQLPSNDIDNWAQFLVQPSVISVNGKMGIVKIGITDIPDLYDELISRLPIVTYEADRLVIEALINDQDNRLDDIESDISNIKDTDNIQNDKLQDHETRITKNEQDIALRVKETDFNEYQDTVQERYGERSAFVQYQSSSGWAKIAQIRLPADNSQRESITFLVTTEDNTSIAAERYTGILELNTHENAASSALKWLVVSGFGLNNFNLRLNGNRLEVWVLPTVGTMSFAVLSETMSGEDVRFIELFDVAESSTRVGTSLGNSEKLTIMTNAEIKAAYEANANTNAYTDEDKAKVDSIEDSIDPNEMAYFNYAGSIYGSKYNLLVSAWEHSLTVVRSEIERNGNTSNQYGRLQYPNGLTEGVIIPNSVTKIGNYAFRNWSSNNQPLVISNSVTSIGYETFYGWSSNNQPLVIPNSVTSIGTQAFRNWAANNHPLIIPNSVTSIGIYAFASWTNVPYIEIKSETPPTLSSSNAFDGQNDAPIYVPDGSVDDYKNATNWSALSSRIFGISEKGGSYISIAYADLVALRDSNGLKKGAFYRITDYETTTVQTDTISAGHLFDIIVQALDEKTLSENASAINSARDTANYFENSKLEAWKLKYSLDNVKSLYVDYSGSWYPAVFEGLINIDGVFYERYYEGAYNGFYILYNATTEELFYSWNGNEISGDAISEGEIDGYDFIVSLKGIITELEDEKNNKLFYDFKNIKFKRYKINSVSDARYNDFLYKYYSTTSTSNNLWTVDANDSDYFYTFDDEGNDASMLVGVYSNEIKAKGITNNVFFGNSFMNNTVGDNFRNNTIENEFRNNTIGNDFSRNIIGYSFNNNTIENSFSDNTIGTYFSNNTIGNSSRVNSIGNYFSDNTINNSFSRNTIVNNFSSNTIGNDFSNNTIGTYFRYNAIGNEFSDNAIGGYFEYNNIGNAVSYNILGDHLRYNTFGNFVQYIQFSLIGTGSNRIRYLHLKDRLTGASSNNRLDLYYAGLYHRLYPTTFEIIANGNVISSWEETPLTRAGKVKATNTTATWSDI